MKYVLIHITIIHLVARQWRSQRRHHTFAIGAWARQRRRASSSKYLLCFPQISFNLTVVHYRLNEESSCQTACDSVRGGGLGGHGSWLLLRLVPNIRACLSDDGELRSGGALARNAGALHLSDFAMPNKNLAEEKANSNGGACDEP